MTLLPTPLEEAAKAIAAQNGDDLETVPTNKSHWNAEAGHFGGRFRTVNEPFRSDYEEQATAAITAYLAQAEKEGWVMVPRTLSNAEVNLALGRDADAYLTPMHSMFRDFHNNVVRAAAAQNGGVSDGDH